MNQLLAKAKNFTNILSEKTKTIVVKEMDLEKCHEVVRDVITSFIGFYESTGNAEELIKMEKKLMVDYKDLDSSIKDYYLTKWGQRGKESQKSNQEVCQKDTHDEENG